MLEKEIKKQMKGTKRFKLLANTYDVNDYPSGKRIRDLDTGKELTQEEAVSLLNRYWTLRKTHYREGQARINAFNRMIESLKCQDVPSWIIKELENALILPCDYEGVEDVK